jgi:hypothetical protein
LFVSLLTILIINGTISASCCQSRPIQFVMDWESAKIQLIKLLGFSGFGGAACTHLDHWMVDSLA